MITKLRNAASPDLYAWIDAHAVEILYAAAPANVGFMDPKLVDVIDRLRKRVGAEPSTKALKQIGEMLGVIVTPHTQRLSVASKNRETFTLGLDDYNEAKRKFDLYATDVQERTGPAGPYVVGSAEGVSVNVPGVLVTLPGSTPMFFHLMGSTWRTEQTFFSLYFLDEVIRDFTPKALVSAIYPALFTDEGRALLSALINKVTPAEEKARAARAARAALLRDTKRGSCSVCFEAIALDPLIVPHGWKMKGGWGRGHVGMYRTGRGCFGANYPAWESSPAGAAAHAADLRNYAHLVEAEGLRRDATQIYDPIAVVTLPSNRRVLVREIGDRPQDAPVEHIASTDKEWPAWNARLAAHLHRLATIANAEAGRYEEIVRRWPIPATDAFQIVSGA